MEEVSQDPVQVPPAAQAGTKQVLVVRKDLKMRRGKELAQAGHASMAFITREGICQDDWGEVFRHTVTPVEIIWLQSSFRKIAVYVESEAELDDLYSKAIAAGITAHIVTDNGTTEFHGVPTKTVLALGPDFDFRLDAITGHLPLY